MPPSDIQPLLDELNFVAEEKLKSITTVKSDKEEREAKLDAFVLQKVQERAVLEQSGFIMSDYLTDCVEDCGNLNNLQAMLPSIALPEGHRFEVTGAIKKHIIIVRNSRFMVIGSMYFDHMLNMFDDERFYKYSYIKS